MVHPVFLAVQNDLHGLTGVVVDHHRALEVYRALSHRVPHHAQGVEAQLLTLLRAHSAQLLRREDGGVVALEEEGVHRYKG